ncbi:MAG: hypothetical protein M0R47_16800 [Methylobacter sp.]|uniref:hypothetical protein n=1 Tax=Methylobacter sp. TaxID=2051955 RepID=UPI0025CCF738|nr:hypothetical protein [Methylobacter sp.]MCK9622182.1 hypothetical protein [Methylobacter sp.]
MRLVTMLSVIFIVDAFTDAKISEKAAYFTAWLLIIFFVMDVIDLIASVRR